MGARLGCRPLCRRIVRRPVCPLPSFGEARALVFSELVRELQPLSAYARCTRGGDECRMSQVRTAGGFRLAITERLVSFSRTTTNDSGGPSGSTPVGGEQLSWVAHAGFNFWADQRHLCTPVGGQGAPLPRWRNSGPSTPAGCRRCYPHVRASTYGGYTGAPSQSEIELRYLLLCYYGLHPPRPGQTPRALPPSKESREWARGS